MEFMHPNVARMFFHQIFVHAAHMGWSCDTNTSVVHEGDVQPCPPGVRLLTMWWLQHLIDGLSEKVIS